MPDELPEVWRWRAGDGPYVINYTANTAAGAPINLAGGAIRFSYSRYRAGVFDRAPVVTKSIGSGITVTNAAAGQFTVTISPADLTRSPSLAGQLRFELEISVGAAVDTIDEGLITVLPELLT